MNPLLPPFGIRHLRDGEDFSILQIDEKQYQSIINPHPEAALSYIDEDDGENVTIGSGFELTQRLADPTTSTAPVVDCYDLAKHEDEERPIHLFDIRKTHTARGVWKEQATAYRRARRHHKKAQMIDSASSNCSTISSIDLDISGQAASMAQSPSLNDKTIELGRSTSIDQTQFESTSNIIPNLVENLATLLQTTSETLRKAAEKSRESETSAIEDVLSGVSNIVTEVGHFGLGLLDSLHDTADSNAARSDVTNPVLQASISTAKSVKLDVVQDNDSSTVNPTTNEAAESPSTTSQAPAVKTFVPAAVNDSRGPFGSNVKFICRSSLEHGDGHNCATLRPTCQTESGCICPGLPEGTNFSIQQPKSNVPLPRENPGKFEWNLNAIDNSILDQDTEDADFSRRYPPLMSLRRANTVAGLHNRFSTHAIDVDENGFNRHNSWINRYPHRPVPYVLDAETRRRKDFARTCFPTQRYTPGPGSKDSTLPSGSQYAAVKAKHDSAPTQPPLATTNKPDSQISMEEDSAIKHDCTFKGNDNVRIVTLPVDSNDALSKFKLAPGAWPPMSQSLKRGEEPLDEESSGALFHRMMRDNPARRQNHASETNDRLTRHRSFTRQRLNRNPFSDLSRSNTVKNAANPASRLNRPFDPLYPVIVPADTAALDVEVKTLHNTVDPSILGTSEPPRSKKLRPLSLQRPFSPVWEEHLNKLNVHENKVSKLDRNGESSSMYSPPPRHMRSVPNLSVAAPAVLSSDAVPEAPQATAPTTNPNVGHSFTALTTSSEKSLPGSLNKHETLQRPLQIALQRQAAAQPPVVRLYPKTPSSSNNPFRQPEAIVPNPLPGVQVPTKAVSLNVSSQTLHECVSSLQLMGYGEFDRNLAARLHVYAAAADGDVTEAVDMIEQDKRASY